MHILLLLKNRKKFKLIKILLFIIFSIYFNVLIFHYLKKKKINNFIKIAAEVNEMGSASFLNMNIK